METQLNLEYVVQKEQEGQYITLPFEMPPDTEVFRLEYGYDRYLEEEGKEDGFQPREEVNIIDLGLVDPTGKQVGASGSDKYVIEVSATYATPGYKPWPLKAGNWQILIGAYKIAPAGVRVSYSLTFKAKRLRHLKGDLHVHTLASDGVMTVEELGWRAVRHGLDFLAITDHNQMVSAESLPTIPGLTLIPGVEWTHFRGHASFLGVDQPYDEPFFSNSLEGVQDRFQSARERGALITINHPFEEVCPFQFEIESLPFDCLEIWNGPMRESNLKAVGLWQQLLVQGKKVPICGGSDYHRDQLFIFPGGPTTCVLSPSASPEDILSALKQGHAYIVFTPDGPSLEMRAGKALMGDRVSFPEVSAIEMEIDDLAAGDVVQVVTGEGVEQLLTAQSGGRFEGVFRMAGPGFGRVEVWRRFVPGIPALPALISNPVYFEG